jgi:hypothetical protein
MTATVEPITENGTQPGLSVGERPDQPPQERARLLSLAGVVRGEEINLRNGIVGGITAKKVSIERGFARAAIAGEELHLQRGAAGTVISAGSAELQQAGAQAVVAAGSIHMNQAGSGFALARQIDVGDHGTVVFGITPHLQVSDGGRVVFGPRAALPILAAIVAIAVASVAFVVSRVRRRVTKAATT